MSSLACSVDSALAVLAAAEALNAVHLGHEVVIEGELLSLGYLASSHKDDVGLTINREVLTDQIRFARVVDIARLAAVESSIDDVVAVEAEVVAVTHAQLVVRNLTLVSHWVSDLLTNILYDDVFWVQSAKQIE